MTPLPMLARCCRPALHVLRHRLAGTIVVSGLTAGGVNVAIRHVVPPPAAQPAAAACPSVVDRGLDSVAIPPGAFVGAPIGGDSLQRHSNAVSPANAGGFGDALPGLGGTLPGQNVPEPPWGVFGFAGATGLLFLLRRWT